MVSTDLSVSSSSWLGFYSGGDGISGNYWHCSCSDRACSAYMDYFGSDKGYNYDKTSCNLCCLITRFKWPICISLPLYNSSLFFGCCSNKASWYSNLVICSSNFFWVKFSFSISKCFLLSFSIYWVSFSTWVMDNFS